MPLLSIRSCRLAVVCVAAGALCASGRAYAQRDASATPSASTATSSLNWVRLPGAESCVTARALAESIERRLQRTVFVSNSQGDLAVEGRIERTNERWIATVAITRANGESLGARTLTSEAPQCHALDESIELVLLLAIDPDALSRAVPTIAQPPQQPPAREEPIVRTVERVRIVERPVVRVERVTVSPPSPWRWGFALGGGASIGVTPSIAPIVWGAAEIAPPRFVAIELSGGGGASIERSTNANVGVSVDAAFAFGAVALCPRATIAARARLGGCVGAQVGALRWSTEGAAGRRTDDFVLAAASARASAALIVRRPFELQLDAGAIVPFVRPKFVVSAVSQAGVVESQAVFEPGPIAAQITVSAVVRFSP